MVKENKALRIRESKSNPVRQLRVRTNMVAGESVEACMKDLDYWRNAYNERCLLK
jgi:hypothetical protein